jgi:predicted nucleic acid-binding protein
VILLDANVLVYALNTDALAHPECRRVVEAGLAQRLPVVLVPQVLLETYTVITDGRRVGRPLEPERAWEQIDILRTGLRVLAQPDGFLTNVGQLVLTGRGAGARIFDASLAAQMRGHGVERVCTLNTRDFIAFPWVRAVRPEELLD